MMKVFFTALFACVCTVATAQESNTLKLWYTKPATQFEEALPLGNGPSVQWFTVERTRNVYP